MDRGATLPPGAGVVAKSGRGLMAVVSHVFGLAGIQPFALRSVGECVWWGMPEAMRRPRYLVEKTTGGFVAAGN